MTIENYKLDVIKMDKPEDMNHFLSLLNDCINKGNKIIRLDNNNGLYIAYIQSRMI